MSTQGIFSVCLVFIILLSIHYASAIRINEIELNPQGSDSGNEWVELYSENEIDLTGYSLMNHDNRTLDLSGIFSGYDVVNFNGQWLDNTNESVRLMRGNEIIDSTPVMKDTYNNDKTWQFCEGWIFVSSTMGEENCPDEHTSVDSVEDGSVETNVTEDKTNENNSRTIEYPAIRQVNLNPVMNVTPEKYETNVVLKLEKGIKTYKSKSEYIKEYSMIGFTLFLAILLIALLKIGKNRRYKDD
jgi:hypothetical protein